MSDMKHALLLCAVAAMTLAACTQDESAEQGAALPEGAYPLVFTAVQLPPAESQTRVADNGNASSWEDGDEIAVSMGGKQAVYAYKGGTWSSDSPLYWESTTSQTVTAWYPVDETIDFTHQDQGLTYLMKGECEGEVSFNTTANLTFTHQLAKVRVLLDGEKADEVADVTVRSYPQSANNQGELGGRIGDPVYVPMLKIEYDGRPCWEATLRDGYFEAGNTFRVAKAGGSPVQVTLAKDRIPVIPGEVTTITITVNSVVPDDATVITDNTGDITDNGEYVVRGSDHTTPINITEGSPTIYLDEATVSVGSGNAINITGGNPTIYVVGEDNTISSGNGAGIYVTEGSTVTIKGSSRDDELTVRGGSGNSGIGGYIDDTTPANSGNINISNITLSVYGSCATYIGNISPGIGCSAEATCGTITISSATVHAFGVTFTDVGLSVPGIGTGFTWVNTYPKNLPDVIVSNSEIHAHRGNPGYTCDYIGWAVKTNNPSTAANSAINPGAGSIKSSTVYCYTGDTLDKTVVYDGSGVGTEQQ